MIITLVDDAFVLHFGMGDVIDQRPSDSSAATGINESVLRTGIKRILAVYKFRMQHHIALLALALQIGQTLPRLEVLGTGNGRCSRGS